MSEREDSPGGGLGAVEREALAVVLNLIIPPSEDGRLPGAAEYDVLGYLRRTAPDTVPMVREELTRLEAHARDRHGRPFATLEAGEARALVDELRGTDPAFMRELARHTVCCYYQQDRVLEAIGLEARAPYPLGHEVEPGDLSLLDPVRRRGRIYRDAE